MSFDHDTAANLNAAVDLVNSAARGEELLGSRAELHAFGQRHDYAPSALEGTSLARMHEVRSRLAKAWRLDDREAAVAFLNAALADADARPALIRHDGWDWHLHFTPQGAPLERIMLAETAMALVDLFREDEWGRLKVCAAPDCDAVLVDLSRNRSKRYCDAANCANRAHVAAYRARRREAHPPDDS
ncbi:MAG: CGNR zinc finger domain-containing protein [Actinomycetales bacterium]